jgi:peroxiredoxin
MNITRAWLAVTLAAIVYAGCDSKAPVSGAISSAPSSAVATPANDDEAVKPETPASGPQLVPAKNDEVEAPPKPTDQANAGQQPHTSFYRADSGPAKMPKVQFTKREQLLCKVYVSDVMPAIELPKVDGGGNAKLASLLGKQATVVVFWKGDRRMTNELLADIAADVIEPFGKAGVEVVGVAVNESAAGAQEALSKAGATFTNLLDEDGKAFVQVGSERLPRIYVLDSTGKIVWFDIEYSHATRRELRDALRALTET